MERLLYKDAFKDTFKAQGAEQGLDEEEENKGHRASPPWPRRELWCVVGPYWPFCLALTTSLSVLVPAALVVTFWHTLPRLVLLCYMALAALELLALASVACRDPGLIPHYEEDPLASVEAQQVQRHESRQGRRWMRNDITSSWRPRGAMYDRDVNAMVDGFDHVCPFTGTAIGSNNLPCFYAFVFLVQAMIYISIGMFIWGTYVAADSGYVAPRSE